MDGNNNWWEKPTTLREFNADIEYILFVDENGHADHIKKIQQKIGKNIPIDNMEAFFTVTGCAINRKDFMRIKQSIIQLKEKHWPPEGKYVHKNNIRRVCLHSRNIRRRDSPFSSKQINISDFLADLSLFLRDSPFVIFSSTLNMKLHAMNYSEPKHPYNLCIDFIVERFGRYFLKQRRASGVLVFEARGKKEDLKLLNHCVNLLKNGTYYVAASDLKNIKGVYFNSKWSKKQWKLKKSYFGLEIADLVSYPIYKYARSNIKDPSYEIIEPKFYGYPDHMGKGLKIFPRFM